MDMIEKILNQYGYVNSDAKIYEFSNTNENDYAKIMLTKNFILFVEKDKVSVFKYEDVLNDPDLIKPTSLRNKKVELKKFTLKDAIEAVEEMDSVDVMITGPDKFDVISLIDGKIICNVKELSSGNIQVYYEIEFNYENISLYHTGNRVICSQKEHFKNAVLEANQANECYKEYISKFNKLM